MGARQREKARVMEVSRDRSQNKEQKLNGAQIFPQKAAQKQETLPPNRFLYNQMIGRFTAHLQMCHTSQIQDVTVRTLRSHDSRQGVFYTSQAKPNTHQHALKLSISQITQRIAKLTSSLTIFPSITTKSTEASIQIRFLCSLQKALLKHPVHIQNTIGKTPMVYSLLLENKSGMKNDKQRILEHSSDRYTVAGTGLGNSGKPDNSFQQYTHKLVLSDTNPHFHVSV